MIYYEKIEALAKNLQDYRANEFLNPKEENIDIWLNQFSTENREVILDEMINIANKLYLTENEVDTFLKDLVNNVKLTNNNPIIFWQNVSLLNIQQNGNSQNEMVQKFKQIIFDEIGINVAINDMTKNNFIYIDDILFTGNRLFQDIKNYFNNTTNRCRIDIIYIGYYKQGQYYYSNQLKTNFTNIDFHFWRLLELENNTNCQNQSCILWPTEDIKGNLLVDTFLDNYKENDQMIYRDLTQSKGFYCIEHNVFTNEINRQILEKEFTLAGLQIINKIGGFQSGWKPLGFSPFKNLGFGSLVISYRNCPNNAPLCLWWGDWNNNPVWYPLFQRKTYST